MKDNIKQILENESLLKKYGSPLYVYDYEILKERCQDMAKFKNQLEKDLDGIKINIHYSTKANSNPEILKVVKDSGLYVDCMSPLELSINEKCNFNKEEILYVCNNIDEEEMRIVHDKKLLICLDSISQVETWGKLFPNTNIMVRINPGVIGIGHNEKVITSGSKTKFGISENNLSKLFEVTKKYNLNIIGVHQHLGSLFLNNKISDYIAGVQSGLNIIKKYFKNIEIIDLGGGFGVPYKSEEEKLDLSKVAVEIKMILKDFCKRYKTVKEFKFEPGRFIPCESGYLVGTVTAIKHENGIYWIGTDIGMNVLVRPSMYDSYHEISLLNDRNSKKIVANICGNVCESGDLIAKNRLIQKPEIGDKIIVHNAGAYGYSMSSNYTGRPRPAEVMIKNGKVKEIRKRETISYMEMNIVW
ncbi:MAG: diaminopimelate decarboxylase [Bacilli bacterium]|nr:diaminopimelate decarboxylase [Bacilli bacterium]